MMGQRIKEIESKLEGFSGEIRSLGEIISAGFTKVNHNFDAVSKHIKTLSTQCEMLNTKLDQLKGDTTDGLEDVGTKLESLTEEIKKIGAVAGYDQQMTNLKGLN